MGFVMRLVAFVCVSLSCAQTFESIDLENAFLVCRLIRCAYSKYLCRSYWYMGNSVNLQVTGGKELKQPG